MRKSLLIILCLLTNLIVSSQNKCIKTTPNYVVINSDRFVRPTKQITVECWIKANSMSDWCAPLSYVTDNGHRESGFAFAFARDKFRFMLKTKEMLDEEWNYNPGIDLELNQWTHIAGTYDGESIKFFKDGELIESKTTSGYINWEHITKNIYIGVFKDFNEKLLFDGQIDEIRIWNIARSNNEIKEFRNKTLTGSESGLIAYYNFDQDIGDVVLDQSTNRINGKLNIPAQEQVFIPSGAMITPKITDLQILSPHSFDIKWETSESILTYDYYMIDLSRNRNFDQLIDQQKSIKRNTTIENITGGTNMYLRIKAFSKDIGFTAYSDILEIADFSTALSINVTSKSKNSKTTSHKLIDYNRLTTNYVGLPSSTRDVQFDFKLSNAMPENIIPGKITITGNSRTYESNFSQSSTVSLFDLKPGKYTIKAEWGAVNLSEPLSIGLDMEIKPMFYQQTFVHLLALIAFLTIIYYLFRKYRIISVKKLELLASNVNQKETPPDWIDPETLEKKASLIKDFITQEKSYLDPKFNLKTLANLVDIPHYQVSKILNDYYRTNFNDFINEFRVKEFISLLKENKNKHIKNSAIAYECGFYSESTFFRAFKKFMGKTPQQYQREIADQD